MIKTLEERKRDKQWWEENVRTKQTEFDLAKKSVKKMEDDNTRTKQALRKSLKKLDTDLKDAKKARDKLDRELKFGKKQVLKIDASIKAVPSRARHWGKQHPGEMINALEGGKYN